MMWECACTCACVDVVCRLFRARCHVASDNWLFFSFSFPVITAVFFFYDFYISDSVQFWEPYSLFHLTKSFFFFEIEIKLNIKFNIVNM